jgi:hypothetical protein
MSESVIRIIVGTPDALYSSVWRYWKHHNDFYISQHGGRHLYKLSLHASGVWRLAFLDSGQPAMSISNDPDPRIIARWKQPTQLYPGWTFCFVVTVPMVKIRERFDVDSLGFSLNSKVRWLEPLPIGHKYTIVLLLAETSEFSPQQVMAQGDEVIGSIELENGRVFWLIARREPMSTEEKKFVDPIPEKTKVHINGKERPKTFVAATVIEPDYAYPALIEIALGYENFSCSD